jgi:amidohydrolase
MLRKVLTVGFCCGVLLFGGTAGTARAQQRVDAVVDPEISSLLDTYKMLHAAPELSGHEEKTAAFLAKELAALGFSVTEHVGKYNQPGLDAYGVVAVMKNGNGPTVLVRGDMDALPVEERTGLQYASKVKTKNSAGLEVPVMHACGHDVHVTALLGTAKALARLKDQWHGTLVLIGQPAEEIVQGARGMLDDGLYTRFPKPDYLLGLHAFPFRAGVVAYASGYFMASSDSVDITIRGIGGHGSRPENSKDPIVVAAEVVLALQTIISRENSPLDPAVLSVGSIHGGTKHNIIPDEVHLQLTVRTYKKEVRDRILAAISRVTKGIAQAAGIPENLAPIVKASDTESVPATYNDPALTERLGGVLERTLGQDGVTRVAPVMGSEDFGILSLEHKIPSFYFFVGSTDPAKIEESQRTGTPLPSNHSSLFAPLPEPTIRSGVKAMTIAVLELMK